MAAKKYKCPNCDKIYVSEEKNPICPLCTIKEKQKIHLVEED